MRVGVELRVPLSVVEQKVDRRGASRALVVGIGKIAVGVRATRRLVADIAVHQQHIAAVLQELV